MEIEGTTFGTITIDGQTYEHDVIIRTCSRKTKRSLSSRRDASSSFSARARWAMCIYLSRIRESPERAVGLAGAALK
jgi:hypothetical protein